MRSTTMLCAAFCAALVPAAATAENFTLRVAMQEKSAATFYVSGEIVGFGELELMVDTGSGYMTINEETLSVLQREQAAQYVKQLQGVLANGDEITVPVYAIERMRIGRDCWLDNVEAAVFPGTSRQILGLSALRRAAPFIFSVEPPELVLSRCGSVPAHRGPAAVGAAPAGQLTAAN